MKVVCVSSSAVWNSEACGAGPLTSETFQISVGAFYTVYGVGTLNRVPCYLVCTDAGRGYPELVPSECFGQPVGFLPGGLTVVELALPEFEVSLITGRFFRTEDHTYIDLADGFAPAIKAWRAFKSYVDYFETTCRPLN